MLFSSFVTFFYFWPCIFSWIVHIVQQNYLKNIYSAPFRSYVILCANELLLLQTKIKLSQISAETDQNRFAAKTFKAFFFLKVFFPSVSVCLVFWNKSFHLENNENLDVYNNLWNFQNNWVKYFWNLITLFLLIIFDFLG